MLVPFIAHHSILQSSTGNLLCVSNQTDLLSALIWREEAQDFCRCSPSLRPTCLRTNDQCISLNSKALQKFFEHHFQGTQLHQVKEGFFCPRSRKIQIHQWQRVIQWHLYLISLSESSNHLLWPHSSLSLQVSKSLSQWQSAHRDSCLAFRLLMIHLEVPTNCPLFDSLNR